MLLTTLRRLGLGLVLLMCCASTSALAAPRQIRLSLDDELSSALPRVHASHREFPLVDPGPPLALGRLIRLELDDSSRPTYGHIGQRSALRRRIRTTLD
jgi:hypothetical protein